jgi:hypothetical protein
MVANNYLLSHLFVKIIFHGYLSTPTMNAKQKSGGSSSKENYSALAI